MKNQIIALILAGGEGNRFWPLGWSKPLISFCGKSVLEYNCNQLQKLNINKIVIVTNPHDEFRVKFLFKSNKNVNIVVQPAAIGMADAILSAKNAIKGSPCLIINAEDLVDIMLYDDLKKFISGEKKFIVGKKVDSYVDVGYLKINGNRVTDVIEKPGEGNEPSDYVTLVFNYFHNINEFCNIIEDTKSRMDDRYEKALTTYIKKYNVEILPYTGYWHPLKYPWHTLEFMKNNLAQLKEFRGRDVQIKLNVEIEGPVYLGDRVKIYENTKIVGPCYLGNDVIIGNNSMVRESHIDDGCVIGFNTDITRSYIGESCWFHSNYVGDSVISDNVSLGSGTKLANFRLDEGDIWSKIKENRINTGRKKLGAMIGRNVRIGVNSSIMPGIKIGEGSFIGAGVILDRDVQNNSFCMVNPTYSFLPNQKSVAEMDREIYKKHIRK